MLHVYTLCLYTFLKNIYCAKQGLAWINVQSLDWDRVKIHVVNK
jgi:hypothetical protein